jgi:D-alanyl-D-alanine endopeptidase (penicillin-binding protein 7)
VKTIAIAIAIAVPVAALAEPALESPHAIAIDARTGDVLYAKRADDRRPIASMTKLFGALALRRSRLDFERWTRIAREDVVASDGGALSLLREGQEFQNRDLFAAMMLSSDNRVPTALARSAGIDLRARMASVVADLGLAVRFEDATGLHDGNRATAREMALALREAIRDPVLRRLMTTRWARVTSRTGEVVAEYTSTIAPLWNTRYKVVGGKTGWTEAAGYCEVVAAEIGGRTVVIALLGAARRQARYDDFMALARWIDSR